MTEHMRCYMVRFADLVQIFVDNSPYTFLLNDSGLRLLVKGKGRKERILQITTPGLLQVVQIYCDMFSKEIQEQGAAVRKHKLHPFP